MKDTLKVAGRIGAELGAAKAENDRLRGLLEAALYYVPSNKTELRALIDAALSQQAEPTDTFTAVDMATAAAQGFRDGQAAVEPSPEQDEREAFKRALHSQKVFKLSSATMSAAEWAWFARPAQTEQQPVSWQFYQDGKWWNGDDRIKDHRKNTEAAGIPVRDLYAAPIAQQPVEQWQVRYLPGQKVEERWWQDSTAERAAWCAEANAERLAKGLPDVWEIRKFYAAPIAQAEHDTFCAYCGGNDEEPQDHCMDCTRPLAQTAPQREQSGPSSWTDWYGGECPVSPTSVVEYRMRRDAPSIVRTDRAGRLDWTHRGGRIGKSDIVAYRAALSAQGENHE